MSASNHEHLWRAHSSRPKWSTLPQQWTWC